MNMQIEVKDIVRFFQGTCSEKEARHIWRLLKENPEIMDSLLDEKEWTDFLTSAEHTDSIPINQEGYRWTTIWDKIYAIRSDRKHRKRIIARYVAAASLVGSLFLWTSTHMTSDPLYVKQDLSASALHISEENDSIIWVNKGSHPEQRLLSDRTKVVLGPGSKLSFKKAFDTDHRWLYLDGKAKFIVAKDKNRPLTVYAGKIGTTAIGTIFSVNNSAAGKPTIVSLIRGRVVVSNVENSAQKIYMSAGESCFWSHGQFFKQRLATYKQTEKNLNVQTDDATFTIDKDLVSFRGTPLPTALTILGQFYNVKIHVKGISGDVLQNATYSGVFNKSHISIESSLNSITSISNLSWAQQDSITYQVFKK